MNEKTIINGMLSMNFELICECDSIISELKLHSYCSQPATKRMLMTDLQLYFCYFTLKQKQNSEGTSYVT